MYVIISCMIFFYDIALGYRCILPFYGTDVGYQFMLLKKRKEQKWEITGENLLHMQRPQCCNLSVKRSFGSGY